MQRISAQQVAVSLNRAVADRGAGYVDPCGGRAAGTPHYRWTNSDVLLHSGRLPIPVVAGQPACLLGWVLGDLGLLDLLHWADNYRRIDMLARDLSQRERLLWDSVAITVMVEAQQQQDRGIPWGHVVSHTLAEINVPVVQS